MLSHHVTPAVRNISKGRRVPTPFAPWCLRSLRHVRRPLCEWGSAKRTFIRLLLVPKQIVSVTLQWKVYFLLSFGVKNVLSNFKLKKIVSFTYIFQTTPRSVPHELFHVFVDDCPQVVHSSHWVSCKRVCENICVVSLCVLHSFYFGNCE